MILLFPECPLSSFSYIRRTRNELPQLYKFKVEQIDLVAECQFVEIMSLVIGQYRMIFLIYLFRY
jgi:hypothetical protein